ncbi:HSF-type DNA-binding-domain-containing protein [Roridomyces roridus]|uniref:HSF-type DNA-binding-domain-containing protein n=1 Tax=Roridomyces roridus TaxID=1738132 RepID=A0AAD7B087_9AGAR|nr:HSF-type DNA-binding-domain-containing protein [Roridomyces roridus]
MVTDPESSRFISWTELGTSFVTSDVGEFTRSVLSSHFQNNSFSAFVRQLRRYGFRKIKRRGQRTKSDVPPTWEFSHHKFLRGRPDLLDEIRKMLNPMWGMWHV